MISLKAFQTLQTSHNCFCSLHSGAYNSANIAQVRLNEKLRNVVQLKKCTKTLTSFRGFISANAFVENSKEMFCFVPMTKEENYALTIPDMNENQLKTNNRLSQPA